MTKKDPTHIPPTPPHLFSISNAVRNAFHFVSDEIHYLARLAAPVIFLQVGLALAHNMVNKEPSSLEIFLWELPGNIMLGWFLCALARLVIFGERLNTLPMQDVRFMQYRARLIKTSIFITLLIKAAYALFADMVVNLIPTDNFEDVTIYSQMILAFSLFLLFWGARFLLVPLLAAVDYPIDVFLKQAKGYSISLRVLGICTLCTVPFFVVLYLGVSMIVSDGNNVTELEKIGLLVFQKPVAVLMAAVFNAGFVFALKEMLGKNEKV